MNNLFGRHEILSPVEEITSANIVQVLQKALITHNFNKMQIDYLANYARGCQPILFRKKKVRKDICNTIVENHAAEIVHFTSGYFLGEPVTYIRRGDREGASAEIDLLNSYMFDEDKASHDKDLATWMAICGVGYRMCLPDKDAREEVDYSPFELDTPDPRHTFVVYNSGFGHRRLMGVRQTLRQIGEDNYVEVNCCYTKDRYFEVQEGKVIRDIPHLLGDIPVFEYRLNMQMMGAFEPAIPLLDALNTLQSNRTDGVEQVVQAFLKFKNVDIDDDGITKLMEMGAISFKTVNGLDGDVSIVANEINQQQTQTLVDYIYDQILTVCGMPTTTKGGTSTSDTGAAVILRDGWTQAEMRARDTELLFKRAEKQFLRLVLRIVRDTRDFKLMLSEVECKFTRRQHDNLLTKTQSLLHMLEAGLNPEVAIATCGLFNDPMDVTKQSEATLHKWDYVPFQPSEDMNYE